MPIDSLDHLTHPRSIAALLKLIHRLPPNPTVVEVGVWAGQTTLELARAGCKVYAVDHWQGNPGDRLGEIAMIHGSNHCFRVFCENMGVRLFNEVIPCRGPSSLWASIWPFPVDLVFIDADHRYEYVKADIEAWRQHVRSDGFICGHDYPEFSGVVKAVDEAFPGVEVKDSVWWRRM